MTTKGGPMRPAALMLCLALAGCAGGPRAEDQWMPDGAEAPAATRAPDPAPAPAAVATRSANPAPPRAPAGAAGPAPPRTAAPTVPDAQRLQEARGLCWMKVEEQKMIRDIDRRVAFVDKCVADAMKAR
jgi:hypothetical protein